MKAYKIIFLFLFLLLSYSAYCEANKGGSYDNLLPMLIGTLIVIIIIIILLGLAIHYVLNRYVKHRVRKPYATIISTMLGFIFGIIIATKVSEEGGFIVLVIAFSGSIAGGVFGYFIFWYDNKDLVENEEEIPDEGE